MTPPSLVHQLQGHARAQPDAPALYDRIDGRWDALSWRAYEARARLVAAGLAALGVRPGDAVVLMGPNIRDWAVAQLGIWCIGAVAAPIYATSTDEQTRYIIGNAGARHAIALDTPSAEKLLRAGNLEHVVAASAALEGTTHLDALLDMGREAGEAAVDAAIADLDEDTLALLIHTSGTTGNPKGVKIDHGNMLACTGGIIAEVPALKDNPHGYVLLSYLPLSHVAEQLFTIMGHLEFGGAVYFCPQLDALKTYLPEVRPTVFVGVPRVWEKFQAALEAGLGQATGLKAKLASWALGAERAAFEEEQAKGEAPAGLGLGLARRLVVDKVKARLGLDRLVYACAGAAPSNPRTLDFFTSLGIVIHEGFGMTETSGAITANPYRKPRFGTVGRAISGVEVKIADDGEILLRGRAMTRGYINDPGATSELLDADGWLHTGDIGQLDPEGFLSITGRKKELLITAGGKNVAPVEIEAQLNAIVGVGQSVVVGDRQPFLTALLIVDQEALPALSDTLGVPVADVATSSGFHAHLEREVEKVNKGLARYQTIKRFHVVPRELTIEGGELTPSLKLRRKIIHERFAGEIEALYATGSRPEAKSAERPRA